MLAFLLAAQAAGMAVDYVNRKSSIEMAQHGAFLERQEIQKQIQYTRLATADESLRAMINLRKNLGTQLSMFASRGIAPGPSAALFSTQSISNFGTDERMRKINQLNTESQLKAHQQITKINQKSFEKSQMNQFYNNSANSIGSSYASYLGNSSKNGGGFGLNKGS